MRDECEGKVEGRQGRKNEGKEHEGRKGKGGRSEGRTLEERGEI